jgi:predicted nucleic acid-binding Zn ribbon protein
MSEVVNKILEGLQKPTWVVPKDICLFCGKKVNGSYCSDDCKDNHEWEEGHR